MPDKFYNLTLVDQTSGTTKQQTLEELPDWLEPFKTILNDDAFVRLTIEGLYDVLTVESYNVPTDDSILDGITDYLRE